MFGYLQLQYNMFGIACQHNLLSWANVIDRQSFVLDNWYLSPCLNFRCSYLSPKICLVTFCVHYVLDSFAFFRCTEYHFSFWNGARRGPYATMKRLFWNFLVMASDSSRSFRNQQIFSIFISLFLVSSAQEIRKCGNRWILSHLPHTLFLNFILPVFTPLNQLRSWAEQNRKQCHCMYFVD